MASTANTSSSSRTRESWGGMGFLLIFFPELEEPISMNPKKLPFFPSSSSSPAPAPARLPSFLRRASSTNLLNKAQSTISICALLVFFSLLLFTLSTVDPLCTHQRKQSSPLKAKPSSSSSSSSSSTHYALQRMGKLHRRGTKAMADLIVGHITESITSHDLRLFLRILHRSGLTSRADIVLIFPSYLSSLEAVIVEENDSFAKLVTRVNKTRSGSNPFDLTQFVKSVKNENKWGEPIWGRKIRSISNNNYTGGDENESTRLSYGSVVSFSANELDPENSLSGFLDHVHMGLRRWATYPMLLGRLRRNFKHVVLIDVSQVLITGDPLTRVRTQPPESVVFFTESTNNKHERKNSGKIVKKSAVPGLVIGGSRGVRRLSAAVLTEIVRVAGESRKKRNWVSESGVFDQLVRNEYLMKSVNVVSGTESISEVSSLSSNMMNSDSLLSSKQKAVIVRRGSSNNGEILVSDLMKQICQQESDSSVYSEC